MNRRDLAPSQGAPLEVSDATEGAPPASSAARSCESRAAFRRGSSPSPPRSSPPAPRSAQESALEPSSLLLLAAAARRTITSSLLLARRKRDGDGDCAAVAALEARRGAASTSRLACVVVDAATATPALALVCALDCCQGQLRAVAPGGIGRGLMTGDPCRREEAPESLSSTRGREREKKRSQSPERNDEKVGEKSSMMTAGGKPRKETSKQKKLSLAPTPPRR